MPPSFLIGLESGRITSSSTLATLSAKNGDWFDAEMDKLDRWAEDRRTALKAELDELDHTIKETKKAEVPADSKIAVA